MGVEAVLRRHQVDCTLVRQTVVRVNSYKTNTQETSRIKAVIQPMTGKELRNMPEGQSTLDWRNIWSLVELRNRDIITEPEGGSFTVQDVEFWREGTFYKATATRLTQGAVS